MSEESKRYIIFDFDGTILLSNMEVQEINPMVSCLVRNLDFKKYDIIIITGRYCYQKKFMNKILSSLGIKIRGSNLYCRENEMPEVEWKKGIFENVLEKTLQEKSIIYEYHEDNPHVLDFVAKIDKQICLYLYTDGFPIILRQTDRCVLERMIENCVRERFGI